MFQRIHNLPILFFLLIACIYACTKAENTTPPAPVSRLSSCDSIKQGLLKTTSDSARLSSCLTLSGCDSIRLGVLKPTTADTFRLISCIKLPGCDSIRLKLLTPTTADTIRLASCIPIAGCDSVRLGILKPNKSDSARLSCLIPAMFKLWGGGMVVYMLQPSDPGYDPNVKHGLVAALVDFPSCTWSTVYRNTGAQDGAYGKGMSNSNKIVAAHGLGPEAAAVWLCKNYRGGGFSDWHLPSLEELKNLYWVKAPLKMQNQFYWTSSECAVFSGNNGLYNWYSAWYVDFSTGNQGNHLKDKVYYARAVRTF